VEIKVCTCLYLGVASSFPPRLLRRRCPREAAKYEYSRSVLRSFPLFTNLCRSDCYELDIKTPQAVAFYRQHEVLYHSLFADVYIVTMSIRRSSHKLSQINEHQLQRGDQCPGFVLAGDIEVFLVSKTLALTFFLAYVAGLLA
jgi:hypothetical protein